MPIFYCRDDNKSPADRVSCILKSYLSHNYTRYQCNKILLTTPKQAPQLIRALSYFLPCASTRLYGYEPVVLAQWQSATAPDPSKYVQLVCQSPLTRSVYSGTQEPILVESLKAPYLTDSCNVAINAMLNYCRGTFTRTISAFTTLKFIFLPFTIL